MRLPKRKRWVCLGVVDGGSTTGLLKHNYSLIESMRHARPYSSIALLYNWSMWAFLCGGCVFHMARASFRDSIYSLNQ